MKTRLTIITLVITFIFSFFPSSLLDSGRTAHAKSLQSSGILVSAAPSSESSIGSGVGSVVRLVINQHHAFQVINQPTGNPGYVSQIPNTLTRFSLADQYQSKGFLAHNNLAGAYFSEIMVGDQVNLFYENQEFETFQITSIRKFQALSPSSPYSEFIDLADGKHYSTSELFLDIYDHPDRLVLQTCLEKYDSESWGRIFVIGVPIQEDSIKLIRRFSNYPL